MEQKCLLWVLQADAVYEYNLSTGFDISAAVYSQSFSVAAQDTAPTALAFNNDGTKMFVLGSTGDDVNEYTLSTGFDVSTASLRSLLFPWLRKIQGRQE
jgi:hypothetical protein